MDRLVALIVRLTCAFAGAAQVMPGMKPGGWHPGETAKILLVGYNGARNTGSDVRVAALAQQITEAFEPGEVELSVMTLDEASTAVYFKETARQVPFNTLFFKKLFEACSENHVIVLCEGSTLKSKFADALTLYNCQAAGIAKTQGKPSIAFGSEIGEMEPYLEQTARDLCSDTYFITRSAQSDKERNRLGLKGHLGTDTAWLFDSSQAQEQVASFLRDAHLNEEKPLLGIAPVNPFCWPVKPSPAKLIRSLISGDRSLQFQSLYFFSWSEYREKMFHAYIDALAQAAITFCAERGYQPVIFGMEKIDEQACRLLNERMGGNVPLVLSKDTDGYFISELLRSLSLLVTSRYHAQVLAIDGLVPTVAVSMDERLDNLSAELGAQKNLLLHVDDADLAPRLLLALDYAYENSEELAETIADVRESAKATLQDMVSWFVNHVRTELSSF